MKKSKAKRLAMLTKLKEEEKRKNQNHAKKMRDSSVHGIKVKRTKFKPLGTILAAKPQEEKNKNLSIVETEITPKYENREPMYEGEMEQREREAQKEIERKKMRVAPAYNKGAYQYITEETNPQELGRKL